MVPHPMAKPGQLDTVCPMQTALVFFMVASAVATLAVLARGIIIMARGQDVSGEQSNRMMSLRVALQALAIMFVVILFLVNRPA